MISNRSRGPLPQSVDPTFSLSRLASLTANAIDGAAATNDRSPSPANPDAEARQMPIRPSRSDGPPASLEGAAARPNRVFSTRTPRVRLADIVLPAVTRAAIGTLVDRVTHHELLYDHWELSRIDPSGRCQAINFYGLPGTGKTLCAEALAAELGRGMIEVNYAEIESKYVGETPKNICQAFDQAAAENAVLFFDEADSILGRRMTNVSQAADQAVNVTRAVMLKQLDAFPGVVVFATNLARNFDSAFVRRILFHIEVAPPGLDERRLLWKRMVSSRVPGSESLDWDRLAAESEGLVGGEIKNAVIIALSNLAPRVSAGERLSLEGMLSAVARVRHAKENVG